MSVKCTTDYALQITARSESHWYACKAVMKYDIFYLPPSKDTLFFAKKKKRVKMLKLLFCMCL